MIIGITVIEFSVFNLNEKKKKKKKNFNFAFLLISRTIYNIVSPIFEKSFLLGYSLHTYR